MYFFQQSFHDIFHRDAHFRKWNLHRYQKITKFASGQCFLFHLCRSDQCWWWYFFICTGVNDHEYVIYDPRDDSEEDWDYWNLICRVIFSIALLCPYLWLVLYINNFGWASFFPSPNWWSFWMQNIYNVVLHQSRHEICPKFYTPGFSG